MTAPLIGITADIIAEGHDKRGAKREATLFLPRRYCRAIEQAGGIPVILDPTSSASVRQQQLNRLDGVVLSGGYFDIHPRYYGEEPLNELGEIKSERTEFELDLATRALIENKPVLGICGGEQAINVCLGGSLYQDIRAQFPGAEEHEQSARKEIGGHLVEIRAGTRLHQIVGNDRLEVNTTHHQAVKKLGKGLVVNAVAPDGLTEGIESTEHDFVIGVQWHPEALSSRREAHQRIFAAFIAACQTPRRDRQ
ncbi:MAG TPA: gamma-glutamyl-gamma-aminobutyrate hydrolase family protein [Candidatus Binatia bacterium]